LVGILEEIREGFKFDAGMSTFRGHTCIFWWIIKVS